MKKHQNIVAFLVVLLVVSIGSYLLIGSHAATPYASTTADSGTAASGALTQSCSGATDGSCVVFGGSTSSNKGVPFIGIDGIYGWGPSLSGYMLNDGFKWDRVETGGGYPGANNAVDQRLSGGGNEIVILPDNPAEAESWMAQYNNSTYASRIIWEFGNEQYLTNSGYTMTAQAYAQAYTQVYNWKHSSSENISQPLLFMTTGDPCWGSLAEDACTNGAELYLEKAMDASKGGVPNLKVDAFSTHTYGGVNGDTSNHTNGVLALLAQHQDAVSHGFTNTPWYVTEWGVTINPAQASNGAANTDCYYAKSYADQASCLTVAYAKMISYGDGVSGTWLKGIMYYNAHDDSTGWFGLITAPNAYQKDFSNEPAGQETGNSPTPVVIRPSYTALKAFLTNH